MREDKKMEEEITHSRIGQCNTPNNTWDIVSRTRPYVRLRGTVCNQRLHAHKVYLVKTVVYESGHTVDTLKNTPLAQRNILDEGIHNTHCIYIKTIYIYVIYIHCNGIFWICIGILISC